MWSALNGSAGRPCASATCASRTSTMMSEEFAPGGTRMYAKHRTPHRPEGRCEFLMSLRKYIHIYVCVCVCVRSKNPRARIGSVTRGNRGGSMETRGRQRTYGYVLLRRCGCTPRMRIIIVVSSTGYWHGIVSGYRGDKNTDKRDTRAT